MAVPPLDAGAVQETVTCPFPRTPVTPVATPGVVAGVTAADAVDAAEVPSAFVAVTTKV